jgi:uncharacterized surface protein with fasciclin (FAS1) repeats
MNNSKFNLWRSFSVLAALGSVLIFSSCNDDENPVYTTNNIVDVASANPNFTTLVAAVTEAGLVDALSAPGPLTVFAPTNAAFSDFLGANNLTADQLLASPGLSDILTYHVVSGAVASGDVSTGGVTTLNGSQFYVSKDPSDKLWINGNSQIIQTDIAAENGIIHVLDYVITAPTQNIAEIAIAASTGTAPEFTQLVAALVRADLVENVSGGVTDNLTVFAPTDAAFEALYVALDVSGVDEIPVELLTDVLLYHVVPARAFSQDLRQNANLPTLLGGQELTVDLANLQINESGLVTSALNIHATNGVIHAIDQVLLPPSDSDASATITISNVGASAYRVDALDGEGATAELGVSNTGIALAGGLRYTFINNGGTNHPLEFRNAAGDVLLSQNAAEGSFESDSAVNFVVDGANVSFTLTPDLAAAIATYNCSIHGAMVGAITITD